LWFLQSTKLFRSIITMSYSKYEQTLTLSYNGNAYVFSLQDYSFFYFTDRWSVMRVRWRGPVDWALRICVLRTVFADCIKSVQRGAGVDIRAKYVRCYPAHVIGIRVNPTNYTRPFAKLPAARSTNNCLLISLQRRYQIVMKPVLCYVITLCTIRLYRLWIKVNKQLHLAYVTIKI